MSILQKAGVVAFGAAIAVGASTGVAAAQSSPAPTVLEVKGEVINRPETLPRTGMDLGYAYVGAGLTGVGVVLVVAARKRRSSSAS